MKVIITTAIVVAFTMISCKKEASADTSHHADSVSAYDNNSMPTNNSSALATDSLNTASQNASSEDGSSTDTPQKSQGDSSGTGRK